jgi:hypothetical protein
MMPWPRGRKLHPTMPIVVELNFFLMIDDADGGMVVHLLFEYTELACILAANLPMETNKY